MSIPFKSQYIIMEPVPQSVVPNNTVFVDASNLNKLSNRDDGGTASELAMAAGGNPFIKTMQSDGLFAVNMPLAKLPNGRVVIADSNLASSGSFCGYALTESTVAGQAVTVLCCGNNIAGAVDGLGFAPGDLIYINENGGYSNDPSTFVDDNDTLVRVGLADCPGGATGSPVATDLIAFHEFVASP